VSAALALKVAEAAAAQEAIEQLKACAPAWLSYIPKSAPLTIVCAPRNYFGSATGLGLGPSRDGCQDAGVNSSPVAAPVGVSTTVF